MLTTDVSPGKDLGTLELAITDEMVQHYIKGLDEPNPWYTTTSPFGGPVAPVIVFQDADSQFKGWYLDNLFGNLWRRQEWEIYAPTRVGQTLRCSARVADRYRRRDRDVVAQEMWVRDEAGQPIARGVHHQSFLAEQTSGEVAGGSGASASATSTGRKGGPAPGGTSPWGPIWTQYGEYGPRTPDWDPGSPPLMLVFQDSGPCLPYDQSFEQTMIGIREAQIPYWPLSSNSNATASEALRQAGFAPGRPPVWSPGWGTPLFP